MTRKSLGTTLILLGLLLLAGAAGLTGYNLWSQQRASEIAQAALDALVTQIPAEPLPELENSPLKVIPDYILNPEMEMPVEEVEGVAYIGHLEIPALGLDLPIISETTYPNLRKAPCRFTGSAYLDDLVIGAHNYASHFGNISSLSQGDTVTFTYMDGNVFSYQVVDFEVLQPSQDEELCSGEWDLSLYTCTFGGRTRITVRCEKLEHL